ncbi:MAG: hypothetical protein VKM98_07590 [Cyanobacteriota bacterium]|nr:hypothetical protein [Cyanobacteriota bacterium]
MANDPREDAWEYQVIHLNVEDDSSKQANAGAAGAAGVAPAAGTGGAASPGASPQPPFSKAYLEQEFPNFYQGPGEQQAAAKHPAQQLQGFLNTLGEQGWQLIGLHPVGKLLMMFFKRPRQQPPAAPATPDPALAQLLARVEQLEQRLGDTGEAGESNGS